MVIDNRLLIERYRYAEIGSLYVEQLAHSWVGDPPDAIRIKVEEKLDSFAEGDLEHAAEMLSALWKIANRDGEIIAPSNSSPDVSRLSVFLLPATTRGTYPT